MWGYPSEMVFKEKVYIGGGISSESARERQQTVVIYDPKLDSCNTLPPYAYKWFSITVVNDQLVLVGGIELTNKKINKLGVWNEQS